MHHSCSLLFQLLVASPWGWPIQRNQGRECKWFHSVQPLNSLKNYSKQMSINESFTIISISMECTLWEAAKTQLRIQFLKPDWVWILFPPFISFDFGQAVQLLRALKPLTVETGIITYLSDRSMRMIIDVPIWQATGCQG